MRIGFDLLEKEGSDVSLGTEWMEVDFDQPFLVELSPEQWLNVESGSLHYAFSPEERSIEHASLHLTLSADEAKKLFLAKNTTEKHVSFSMKEQIEFQLMFLQNNLTFTQKNALIRSESPDGLLEVLNEEGYPILLDLRHYNLMEVVQCTVVSDTEEATL